MTKVVSTPDNQLHKCSAAPLRIWCWEGYDDRALLAPFSERHRFDIAASPLISDADAAERIIKREPQLPDVLNINNAYVAKALHPNNRIQVLNPAEFAEIEDQYHPDFKRLYRWSRSSDETKLLGICQRFGPFNFVVNTSAISVSTAREVGFDLAADPALRGRYGILLYEDFNIFHICIAAGLNPFRSLSASEIAAFEKTAQDWFEHARIVSADHHQLNKALVSKEIDLYLSGGIYTASAARAQGHLEVCAVTPNQGPIDGKGGIAFTEITCVLNDCNNPDLAVSLLKFFTERDTAVQLAKHPATCNPIAQLGSSQVFSALDRSYFDAIQWETLAADIERCADYDIVPNHSTLLASMRRARASNIA